MAYGTVLYDAGCSSIDLPSAFRIIGQLEGYPFDSPGGVMFRCTSDPVAINFGVFKIYESKPDLIWDEPDSFLVLATNKRFRMPSKDIKCKASQVFIFYGEPND